MGHGEWWWSVWLGLGMCLVAGWCSAVAWCLAYPDHVREAPGIVPPLGVVLAPDVCMGHVGLWRACMRRGRLSLHFVVGDVIWALFWHCIVQNSLTAVLFASLWSCYFSQPYFCLLLVLQFTYRNLCRHSENIPQHCWFLFILLYQMFLFLWGLPSWNFNSMDHNGNKFITFCVILLI